MNENENSAQSQLITRLAQAQPLRELARSWYALSVACRRMGAMIERDAKEMSYAPIDNEENTK